MNTAEINEIKDLFQKLMSILDNQGDTTLINQKRIIQNILYVIETEMDDNKKVIEIQREYSKLFPSRGGLSDFYIWRDNFEERKAINEPLDAIRKRLWEILK